MAASTVVFDIGNVLIEWDPRHLYRQLFSDGDEMEWFLTHVCSNEWNRRQDAGRAWADAEAELIPRFLQFAEQIRAFRARWPEMVPGPIPGMFELLEGLQAADVPLFAITNFAADTFEMTQARFPLLRQFKGIAVSGSLGMLKPEPGIYRWLIETYGIDPNSALFIDDSLANVEGARALGFHAHHFTGKAGLMPALGALGIDIG